MMRGKVLPFADRRAHVARMSSLSSFHDDDEFPFSSWCSDTDICPHPNCPWCDGLGTYQGEPCTCMIEAAFRTDPEAAAQAYPDRECPRCVGDGEDFDGSLCPCQLTAFIQFIADRID